MALAWIALTKNLRLMGGASSVKRVGQGSCLRSSALTLRSASKGRSVREDPILNLRPLQTWKHHSLSTAIRPYLTSCARSFQGGITMRSCRCRRGWQLLPLQEPRPRVLGAWFPTDGGCSAAPEFDDSLRACPSPVTAQQTHRKAGLGGASGHLISGARDQCCVR